MYKPLSVVKTCPDAEKASRSRATALFNARNKRKNERQQASLPQYLSNPDELVGHRIKHLARDPGEEASWFDAVVDSVHTYSMLSMMSVMRCLIFHF